MAPSRGMPTAAAVRGKLATVVIAASRFRPARLRTGQLLLADGRNRRFRCGPAGRTSRKVAPAGESPSGPGWCRDGRDRRPTDIATTALAAETDPPGVDR